MNDSIPTVIVRRFTPDSPKFESLELELENSAELDLLLTLPGQSRPVRHTRNGSDFPQIINHGASDIPGVFVELLSPPSAGDWLIFGLGLWLARRRSADHRAPDEWQGERAATFAILMKRPALRAEDLVRIAYSADNKAGVATYEFRAHGSTYRVGVSHRMHGQTTVVYFYESIQPPTEN